MLCYVCEKKLTDEELHSNTIFNSNDEDKNKIQCFSCNESINTSVINLRSITSIIPICLKCNKELTPIETNGDIQKNCDALFRDSKSDLCEACK